MRNAELIRYLVLAAQREGNLRLTRELRPLGVTPSQAEVVRVLAEHEPLTLTGLGRLLICESGTNPSRLVDRLADAGLVERLPDPSDRRSVMISLTRDGWEADAGIRRVEERLYADIDEGTAGADLDSVIALLRSLSFGRPSGDALDARVGTDTAGARASDGEERR